VRRADANYFQAGYLARLGAGAKSFASQQLLLQNRLWCADRLMRRGWPNENFCQLCVRQLETHSTYSFTASSSSKIGHPSLVGLDPAVWEHIQFIQDVWYAMVEATENPFRKGSPSLIILTCWHTWKEGNNRVFDNRIASVQHVTETSAMRAENMGFQRSKGSL
jgi:hypothetical protein